MNEDRCYLLNQGSPWGSYHEAAEALDNNGGRVFVPVEWDNDYPHPRGDSFADVDRDAVAAALADLRSLGFGPDVVTFAVELDEPDAEGDRSDLRVTWGIEVRSEAALRVVLGIDPWEGPATRFDVIDADGLVYFHQREKGEAVRLAELCNDGPAPAGLTWARPFLVVAHVEEGAQR